MPYWVTFTDRNPGSIEVKANEKPLAVAAQFGTVKGIDAIPYPADPCLRNYTGCPSFCYSPQTCAGRSACPKSYACSE